MDKPPPSEGAAHFIQIKEKDPAKDSSKTSFITMGGSSTGVQDDPHHGSYAAVMGFDQADIAATQHIQATHKRRADDKAANERSELDKFRLASATPGGASAPPIRVPLKKSAATAALPVLKRKLKSEAGKAPKKAAFMGPNKGEAGSPPAAPNVKAEASVVQVASAGFGGLVSYSSGDSDQD
jgi:hypothetical protein